MNPYERRTRTDDPLRGINFATEEPQEPPVLNPYERRTRVANDPLRAPQDDSARLQRLVATAANQRSAPPAPVEEPQPRVTQGQPDYSGFAGISPYGTAYQGFDPNDYYGGTQKYAGTAPYDAEKVKRLNEQRMSQYRAENAQPMEPVSTMLARQRAQGQSRYGYEGGASPGGRADAIMARVNGNYSPVQRLLRSSTALTASQRQRLMNPPKQQNQQMTISGRMPSPQMERNVTRNDQGMVTRYQGDGIGGHTNGTNVLAGVTEAQRAARGKALERAQAQRAAILARLQQMRQRNRAYA